MHCIGDMPSLFLNKHFRIIIHISFACTRAPNELPQSLKFKIHGVGAHSMNVNL